MGQPNLRFQPLDVGKTLMRAATAKREGKIERAMSCYNAVLEQFPANRRARLGLRSLGPEGARQIVSEAQAYETSGQYECAEACWSTAARLCPDSVNVGVALCRCRLKLGRPHDALTAIDKVLEWQPHAALALDARGCALRDLGQFAEAERCFLAALRNDATDAGPLNHLGILSEARGDGCAAERHFREALSWEPRAPELHANLARVLHYRRDDPHIAEMEQLLAQAPADDTGMAPLHFALFKAYDALDECDRAFAHLVVGNVQRKIASGYDISSDALQFVVCKALLAGPMPDVGAIDRTGPRPIFVVGLPRSGTTLVEQILSGSDGVQPGGELSVVSDAASEMLRKIEDEGRMALTRNDLARFRKRVLGGLARHSNGAPVLIDKMPLNFRWTGFLCAALPEAHFVHVRRNPVSVAWSLFRHAFSGPGNGYAYDMADIASYIALYQDLMRDVQARFGNRITHLDYGAMVANPEASVRTLIRACNLSWSDDCLAPHLSEGPILTASAAQVRKPIYPDSDMAWKRYEVPLAPLLEALRVADLV